MINDLTICSDDDQQQVSCGTHQHRQPTKSDIQLNFSSETDCVCADFNLILTIFST